MSNEQNGAAEGSESDTNALLCATASTTGSGCDEAMTMEKLDEAMALIKALAPKEAPEGEFLIKGVTGLNIIKNDMLAGDTIVVSKSLFDRLYAIGT